MVTNEKLALNVEKFVKMLDGARKQDAEHLARKKSYLFRPSFLEEFENRMRDCHGKSNEKAMKILRRLCKGMVEMEHFFEPEMFDIEKLKREEKEKEKREQKKRETEEKRQRKRTAHAEKMKTVKKVGAEKKPKQVYRNAPKPKAKAARH